MLQPRGLTLTSGTQDTMNCDCHIEVRNQAQKKVLLTLLAISGARFAVEIVTGILADSSCVRGDFLDMLPISTTESPVRRE